MINYQSKITYYYGTGRRKTSVAKVKLYANGNGKISVNKKDINEYFGLETLKLIIKQPMEVTKTLGNINIEATVSGGGFTGQAGAIRHGISRALLQFNMDEYKLLLKKSGFLTRDSRMKERKKYGLKAARKAPQFSKR